MNDKIRALTLFPALLASLIFSAACSTNPATGKQSFTAFMSREDEIRIGAEEHPAVGGFVPIRALLELSPVVRPPHGRTASRCVSSKEIPSEIILSTSSRSAPMRTSPQ